MSDYTYSLPFSNDRFMKGIIMMLKKENKLISDRLRDMSGYLEGDVPNRKPPPY